MSSTKIETGGLLLPVLNELALAGIREFPARWAVANVQYLQ